MNELELTQYIRKCKKKILFAYFANRLDPLLLEQFLKAINLVISINENMRHSLITSCLPRCWGSTYPNFSHSTIIWNWCQYVGYNIKLFFFEVKYEMKNGKIEHFDLKFIVQIQTDLTRKHKTNFQLNAMLDIFSHVMPVTVCIRVMLYMKILWRVGTLEEEKISLSFTFSAILYANKAKFYTKAQKN